MMTSREKLVQVSREKPLQAESRPTVTEEIDEELQVAWGDVSGRELHPSKVRKARAEEVGYIHKTNIYTKGPRSKALEAGAGVISVRWLDINKGDAIVENYGSRRVAREIKRDGRPDLFAAARHLEVLKVIISTCASSNNGELD